MLISRFFLFLSYIHHTCYGTVRNCACTCTPFLFTESIYCQSEAIFGRSNRQKCSSYAQVGHGIPRTSYIKRRLYESSIGKDRRIYWWTVCWIFGRGPYSVQQRPLHKGRTGRWCHERIKVSFIYVHGSYCYTQLMLCFIYISFSTKRCQLTHLFWFSGTPQCVSSRLFARGTHDSFKRKESWWTKWSVKINKMGTYRGWCVLTSLGSLLWVSSWMNGRFSKQTIGN